MTIAGPAVERTISTAQRADHRRYGQGREVNGEMPETKAARLPTPSRWLRGSPTRIETPFY